MNKTKGRMMKKLQMVMAMVMVMALGVSADLVVKFNGDGDVGVSGRAPDSGGIPTAQWDFSDTEVLVDASADSQSGKIYGGMKTAGATLDPVFQAGTSSRPIQALITGADTTVEGLFVWNKADFLSVSGGDTISFETGDSFSITLGSTATGTDGRLAINQDGTWYVSDSNLTVSAGTLIVDPSAVTWRTISTDNTYTVGGTASSVTFDNVLAVGVYVSVYRTSSVRFVLNDITVNATVTPKPVTTIVQFNGDTDYGVAGSAPDSGGVPTAQWDFSTTEALVDASAESQNGKIYGGMVTTGATADPYFQAGTDTRPLQALITGSGTTVEGMFVWNKADFLAGSSDIIMFESGDSLSVTLGSSATTSEGRLVINQNGTWYVSDSALTTSAGTLDLDPSAVTWRTISTDNTYTIGETASSVTFDNVLAVGVYASVYRTTSARFVLMDITANATVVIEPEPVVLTIASGADLVTISVTGLIFDQTYALESSPDLISPDWQPAGVSVTGISATNWVFSATNDAAFYRLDSE